MQKLSGYQKLNKAQIKALPAPVAQRVIELQSRYHTRHCSLCLVTPETGVYLAEDADYTFFNKQNETMQVNMDGEWSGISRHPVRSAIGKNAPLPEGCYCVEHHIFLGQAFIYVYKSSWALGE